MPRSEVGEEHSEGHPGAVHAADVPCRDARRLLVTGLHGTARIGRVGADRLEPSLAVQSERLLDLARRAVELSDAAGGMKVERDVIAPPLPASDDS